MRQDWNTRSNRLSIRTARRAAEVVEAGVEDVAERVVGGAGVGVAVEAEGLSIATPKSRPLRQNRLRPVLGSATPKATSLEVERTAPVATVPQTSPRRPKRRRSTSEKHSVEIKA